MFVFKESEKARKILNNTNPEMLLKRISIPNRTSTPKKRLIKEMPINEISLKLDQEKTIRKIPSCKSDSTINTWIEENDEKFIINVHNHKNLTKKKGNILNIILLFLFHQLFVYLDPIRKEFLQPTSLPTSYCILLTILSSVLIFLILSLPI